MRADLPRGTQAAQLVHAAGESARGVAPGTYAVVLCARDEAALADLAARLHAAGVEFCAIVESDAPWSGQLMALGIAPRRKEDVRRLLSSLPLLK